VAGQTMSEVPEQMKFIHSHPISRKT